MQRSALITPHSKIMGIESGTIHNLVRTYQRVLNLEESGQAPSDLPPGDPDDRVTISEEARQLQQGALKPGQQGSAPRR